jgi:DNA-binding winged helix-turn-helix (wHTH) protein
MQYGPSQCIRDDTMSDHSQASEIRRYRFGRFELLPAQRRLLADGVSATLGSRAFDVLVALIERRAEVLTKDELLERVWPGLVVEQANVQVQVSALRKVIGADAVATVQRRGYQFVAPVECDCGPSFDRPNWVSRVALAAVAPGSRSNFLNSFEFLRTLRAAPATFNSRQTIKEQEA